jgi:hypothetical protein
VAVTLRIQATARSEADARTLAEKVAVDARGAAIRVDGPSSRGRPHWSASLVVRVPRKTGLNASTENGPLSIEGVSGTLDLRSTNGPLSLADLSGDVRARAQQDPPDHHGTWAHARPDPDDAGEGWGARAGGDHQRADNDPPCLALRRTGP